MTKVFISYRTGDESFAAVALDNRLSARFGADNVFRDSRHIGPGVDFEPELWRNLAGSSAVLVVIGPRWLTGTGSANCLERPADFVRRELELAFQLELPVIPVLVGDAALPDPADLPESLKRLVRCQGLRIHSRTAEADTQMVVDRIHRAYGDQPQTRPGTVVLIRAESGPAPEGLAALVRSATADAGVPQATVEQLPDGVQVIQPDATHAVALVGDFVTRLDDGLRAAPGLGLVRVAMHYGEVVPGPEEALRVARGLLAEPALDRVLPATAGARMVLVASNTLHQVSIKPGHPSIDKSTYTRIRSAVDDAWVRVPGFPAARGLPTYEARPQPPPSAPAPPQGGTTYQIENVHGDIVNGDKILTILEGRNDRAHTGAHRPDDNGARGAGRTDGRSR